jgi:hypothetical protein
LSSTPGDQLTDAWAERLIQLKRDIEKDRASIDSVEQELAEAASLIGKPVSGFSALNLTVGKLSNRSFDEPF